MVNKKEMIVYETDASRLIGKAEKIVFPQTIEEVQSIVKTSNLDIVPRGAGSGLVGGSIPKNSLIVDLNKMKNVFDLDKIRKVIYVEAGVTLKELNDKLSAIGFEFPVQPLNKGISTIGGMIATNASGVRDLKYDCMRNWIEEIQFVDGRGELVKTSKSDLMDICSMEGITGIIVGAKLKIMPKINRTASIFQSENLEEVLSISRRLKLEKDICMLLFFSKEVSRILGLPEKYHIIIEFDSDRGKIKRKDYSHLMNLKENIYGSLAKENYFNSEDPKFFQDKLKDFILFLESSQIPYFGHLGKGVIHPFFKDEEENKRNGCFELMKRMRCKLGEYGFGIARKDFLEEFDIKIIKRVKLRHDPFAKLNQGKIIRFNRKKSKEISRIKPKEIKPLEGEKLGAVSVVESIKHPEEMENLEFSMKKPSEKMDKLIKEAKVLDNVKEKIQEDVKEKIQDTSKGDIVSIEKTEEKPVQKSRTVGEVLDEIILKKTVDAGSESKASEGGVSSESKASEGVKKINVENNSAKMSDFVQRVEYEEKVYRGEDLKQDGLNSLESDKEYIDLSEEQIREPKIIIDESKKDIGEIDITKIMTNQIKRKKIEEKSFEDKSEKFDFQESIKRPEIDGSQEVDGGAVPRGKISENEKDLINNIMGNRFGFGNGDKKENDDKKSEVEK